MLKQSAAVTLLFAGSLSAGNIINASVGPVWPEAKMIKANHPRTAWNVSGSWGKVFDKRFILGAKADLTWHVTKLSSTVPNTDTSLSDFKILSKTRAFMVPVCGWVAVDPIPQYRLHPVVSAQVGYNSLFWSQSNYDDGTGVRKNDQFKYYNGFYTKFGADAMFDLGKQASIFAGFEYQIAPLYHRSDKGMEMISFNAPAIRLGMSFLY